MVRVRRGRNAADDLFFRVAEKDEHPDKNKDGRYRSGELDAKRAAVIL